MESRCFSLHLPHRISLKLVIYCQGVNLLHETSLTVMEFAVRLSATPMGTTLCPLRLN